MEISYPQEAGAARERPFNPVSDTIRPMDNRVLFHLDAWYMQGKTEMISSYINSNLTALKAQPKNSDPYIAWENGRLLSEMRAASLVYLGKDLDPPPETNKLTDMMQMLFAGSIGVRIDADAAPIPRNMHLLSSAHLLPAISEPPYRTSADHVSDYDRRFLPHQFATSPEINHGQPYRTIHGQERYPVAAKTILKALADAAQDSPRYLQDAIHRFHSALTWGTWRVESSLGILEVVNNLGLRSQGEYQALVSQLERNVSEGGLNETELTEKLPYKYLYQYGQEIFHKSYVEEGKPSDELFAPNSKNILLLQKQVAQLEEDLYRAGGNRKLLLQAKGVLPAGKNRQQVEAELLAARKKLEQETQVFQKAWGDCCDALGQKYFPGEKFNKDNHFRNTSLAKIIKIFAKDKEFPEKAKLIDENHDIVRAHELSKFRQFGWMYGVPADWRYRQEFINIVSKDPASFSLLLKMFAEDVFKHELNVQDRQHRFLNSQSNSPSQDGLLDIINSFASDSVGARSFQQQESMPERMSEQQARKEWEELLENLKKLSREETETTRPHPRGQFEYKGHAGWSLFHGEGAGCLPYIGGAIGALALLVAGEQVLLNNYVDYQVKMIETTGKEAGIIDYLASKLSFLAKQARQQTPEAAAQAGSEKAEPARDASALYVPPELKATLEEIGLQFPVDSGEFASIVDVSSPGDANVQIVNSIIPEQIPHSAGQLVIQVEKGMAEDVAAPIGWSIDKVFRTDKAAVMVLSPESWTDVSDRIKITNTTVDPYLAEPDLGRLNSLNQELSGDLVLQELHLQFYTQLSAANNADEQSEIILKYMHRLGDWVNENKFYSFKVGGGLEWTADNPEAGFSCTGASELTADFLRSAGVSVEENPVVPAFLRGNYFWSQWGHRNNIVHLPNGRVVLVENQPLFKEGQTPAQDFADYSLDEPSYFALHMEEANRVAGELGIGLEAAFMAMLAAKTVEGTKKPQLEDAREIAQKFNSENSRPLSNNEVVVVSAAAAKLSHLSRQEDAGPEILSLLESVCRADADAVVVWANTTEDTFAALAIPDPIAAFDAYAEAAGSRQTTYFSDSLNEAVRMRNGQLSRASDYGLPKEEAIVPEEFQHCHQLARSVFDASVEAMAQQLIKGQPTEKGPSPRWQATRLIKREIERLYRSFDPSWPETNKAMLYSLYQLFS